MNQFPYNYIYWLRPYLHAQHGRMMLRIWNECIAYEPDFHGNCTNLWRRRGPDHGRMHRQYNFDLLGIPSEETDLKTLSKLSQVSKSPTPWWWSQWSEIFFCSFLFSSLQLMHRWGTWNIVVVTVNSQTTKNTILSLFLCSSHLIHALIHCTFYNYSQHDNGYPTPHLKSWLSPRYLLGAAKPASSHNLCQDLVSQHLEQTLGQYFLRDPIHLNRSSLRGPIHLNPSFHRGPNPTHQGILLWRIETSSK